MCSFVSFSVSLRMPIISNIKGLSAGSFLLQSAAIFMHLVTCWYWDSTVCFGDLSHLCIHLRSTCISQMTLFMLITHTNQMTLAWQCVSSKSASVHFTPYHNTNPPTLHQSFIYSTKKNLVYASSFECGLFKFDFMKLPIYYSNKG